MPDARRPTPDVISALLRAGKGGSGRVQYDIY